MYFNTFGFKLRIKNAVQWKTLSDLLRIVRLLCVAWRRVKVRTFLFQTLKSSQYADYHCWIHTKNNRKFSTTICILYSWIQVDENCGKWNVFLISIWITHSRLQIGLRFQSNELWVKQIFKIHIIKFAQQFVVQITMSKQLFFVRLTHSKNFLAFCTWENFNPFWFIHMVFFWCSLLTLLFANFIFSSKVEKGEVRWNGLILFTNWTNVHWTFRLCILFAWSNPIRLQWRWILETG